MSKTELKNNEGWVELGLLMSTKHIYKFKNPLVLSINNIFTINIHSIHIFPVISEHHRLDWYNTLSSHSCLKYMAYSKKKNPTLKVVKCLPTHFKNDLLSDIINFQNF